MRLRISIIEQNQSGEEKIVKEFICTTDSVNRALQMYEPELSGRKMQRLEYEILPEPKQS